MAATLVLALAALFLAFAAHSDATYCVCNTVTNDALQRNIDYACGNGADCTAINQNGACFNPNTVRDHCNYAVNSYYQRRNQATGSCDFSGTASIIPNPPSGTSSGCVYQASPSGGGTTGTPATGGTTPGGSTTPPTGGGTTTTPPGSSTTPGGASPGSGSTNPGSTTPGGGSSTNPGGMTPGSMVPPGGTTGGGINTLGPSGGLGPDFNNAGVSLSLCSTGFMLVLYSASFFLSGLVWQRV